MIELGKILETKKNLKFKVIEKIGNRYVIEFLKTGYKTNISYNTLKNRNIKDRYVKTIFDVGFLGEEKVTKKNERLYHIWYRNLRKCYYENDKDYKNYGAKGVIVSDRWHNFSNFLNDVIKLEGWEESLYFSNHKQLDKDFKGNGKLYSHETCMWLSMEINVGNTNRNRNVIGIDPDGKIYKFSNTREFARLHNLNNSAIGNVLAKTSSNHKKWVFYYND